MATTTRPIKGSTASAFLLYLQDAERTMDYYREGDGFDRVWGSLQRDLGITEQLSAEQWEQLFHGAWEGERLTRKNDKRVPMMDLTLSAPKSVSELMVSADAELRAQIQDAMWIATRAAFDYFEETALMARVREKVLAGDRYESVQRRHTARLLATPVMQFCARPTDKTIERGAPPDPSLHVHVPIFTVCRVGERWLTADNWGAKKAAEHVDQVFMGELARQLEHLGIAIEYSDIERSKNGKVRWEVAGSHRETRDHWSSNRERMWEIVKEYEERVGKPIDEEYLRYRMYLTRGHKSEADKEQDSRPEWELWRQDAEASGVPLIDIHRRPIERSPYASLRELRERLVGPAGWARDGAVFDEPTIGQAVRRCAVGLGFSPEELAGFEAIVRNEKELVPVRDGQHPEDRLYTTRTLLDAERRISIARQMRGDRWVDITGPAGTGKSTMAAAAVKLLRGQNPDLSKLNDGQRAAVSAITYGGPVDQVICVSTAATAAEETGLKIRADHYGSFESVVTRLERRTLRTSPRTLIVVEEAGMVDTLRMDRLLKAAGDARIATLGDHHQLSPIGAGGWYQDNIEQFGSIELTEVRRQVDPDDIRDLDLIRNGRATEALANMKARGRVHETETDADRVAQVLAAYQAHREAGRSAADIRVVMDTSNVEVDTVNRFVQRDRQARREIGQDGLDVHSEKLDRRWTLHENDQVVTVDTHRIRGERNIIGNGSKGVVRKIEGDRTRVRVRFENGKEAIIPVEKVMPAYALHVNKVQGGEAPILLGVPGRQQTNKEAGYTIPSRGIEELHVFVSQESNQSLEHLGELWERSAVQESASRQIARERARDAERDITEDIGLPRGIRPRSTSRADDFSPSPQELRSKIEQERELGGWER